MNIKQFQIQSKRTAPFNADPKNVFDFQNILVNYAAGAVGEWHEYRVELDKVDTKSEEVIPMKLVNTIESEIGDVMHYVINLLTILKVDVDEEVIKYRPNPTANEIEIALANILEVPKKYVFHGHELDKEKLVDAIYTIIVHFCKTYEFAIEIILKNNIEKLKLRYPGKFNSEDSVKRVDAK